MKKIFCFLFLLTVCGLLFAETEMKRIPVNPADFTGRGHIQGLCCSDRAIYFAQAGNLYKFSWEGKLLKMIPVIRHTGDICFWKGKIYTSVAYMDQNVKKGLVQVFDEDLKLVQEHKLSTGRDGITIMNGVLYTGLPSREGKAAHRENFLSLYDAETMRPLKENVKFDYGFDTSYGVQGIAHDGKHLFLAFYKSTPETPSFVICNPDLKVIKVHKLFTAPTGFDLIPKRLRGEKLIFVCLRPEFNVKKLTLAFYEFDPEKLDFIPVKLKQAAASGEPRI